MLCACLVGSACSGDDSGDPPADAGDDEDGGGSGEGGGGGSGGSGGTGGTGGSGGSGGTGGSDASTDECEGVENPCTAEGTTCEGKALVVCQEDEDGCLVETSIECDDYCDSAEKQCGECDDLPDSCEQGGASCDGDTLTVCATNADGCLVATEFDCTAGDNEYCDADAATPVCVDCADLDNACDDEGTSCDGNTLVTCAEDENGCMVATETDCTDGDTNFCDPDADPDPACVDDVCRDEDGVLKEDVCVDDVTSCQEDILVTCVEDEDGCPIAARTDCTTDGDNNYCDPDADPEPACDFDPCLGVTDCLVEGVTCDGTDRITCAPNADSCLVETVFDCTVGETVPETCDVNAGPDYCTPCADDVGCETAVEGDMSCTSNVLGTCTDIDGDTCLNLVEEDCGDDFTCDAAEGCVYSGDDVCAEDVPVERVLRGNSSQSFTTVGMTASDYGPWPTNACPGQFFAIGTTNPPSPDLLFAVDVPPQSVAEVALSIPTPTTFTSNTWLFLTSSCEEDSADGCLAYSAESVEYTNVGDTTTRVYVVFEASTPSGGPISTGMFGLEVLVRPLGCGDGKRDGEEECDDGNVFNDDGCSPACELETGYVCTDAEPSVCTSRPATNVCGNVTCPALPDDFPENGEVCCTPEATCGIAYEPYYGASCIERQPDRPTNNTTCPDATARGILALFIPALQGCCRTDGKCGLTAGVGAGCVERTDTWTALEDGAGSFFYGPTPFAEVACTP